MLFFYASLSFLLLKRWHVACVLFRFVCGIYRYIQFVCLIEDVVIFVLYFRSFVKFGRVDQDECSTVRARTICCARARHWIIQHIQIHICLRDCPSS